MMIVTFQFHAHVEALVEATCRTLLASSYGDRTRGPSHTDIVLPVLYSALEESLATLTGEDSVVKSGDLIPADWTRAGTTHQ